MEFCVGRCAALLRTCARIPLLEVGAADIRVGMGTHAPGVCGVGVSGNGRVHGR
jgi:hypothetical protein